MQGYPDGLSSLGRRWACRDGESWRPASVQATESSTSGTLLERHAAPLDDEMVRVIIAGSLIQELRQCQIRDLPRWCFAEELMLRCCPLKSELLGG